MPIQPLLERAIDQIPECQAAAVMDLATGMVLASHTLDADAAQHLDALLPATVGLFEERSLAHVDRALSASQPGSGAASREVLLVGSRRIQLFLRGKQNQDIVLVTLVDSRVGVSEVLPEARRVLGAVEGAL
ncbi:MAG: hypothetical protein R3B07_25780 [Polyangiaceae bacterium]